MSAGQLSCTATVIMTVTNTPAIWGCAGQNVLVKSSFHAQKPAAVPIKLAINEILKVLMNASPVLYEKRRCLVP